MRVASGGVGESAQVGVYPVLASDHMEFMDVALLADEGDVLAPTLSPLVAHRNLNRAARWSGKSSRDRPSSRRQARPIRTGAHPDLRTRAAWSARSQPERDWQEGVGEGTQVAGLACLNAEFVEMPIVTEKGNLFGVTG
ncbi:MAG TPA: hypothetical protein VFV38_13610 [Ktedonobacteraceae bacterium]|nr:hypothetical protein [Ktedonobacteraceae bacterium]